MQQIHPSPRNVPARRRRSPLRKCSSISPNLRKRLLRQYPASTGQPLPGASRRREAAPHTGPRSLAACLLHRSWPNRGLPDRIFPAPRQPQRSHRSVAASLPDALQPDRKIGGEKDSDKGNADPPCGQFDNRSLCLVREHSIDDDRMSVPDDCGRLCHQARIDLGRDGGLIGGRRQPV